MPRNVGKNVKKKPQAGSNLFQTSKKPTPMDTTRAELLEDTPFDRVMAWRELETLASYMGTMDLKAEVTLFKEGDPGDYMGVIVSGEIGIFKEDSTGAVRKITSIVKGSLLGEMAPIDGERRSATAIALADTQILILRNSHFERLTQENPSVGLKLLMLIAKMLSQRLRRTSGVLVDNLS